MKTSALLDLLAGPTGTAPHTVPATESMGRAMSYLQTVQSASVGSSTDSPATITSLVPAEPSEYRKYMSAGEKAMREGNYGEAFRQFRLAGYLARRSPEPLVSMAHAKFATSSGAYSQAALYLARAMEIFPELPLTAMDPSSFFPDEKQFAVLRSRLDKAAEAQPNNADINFVLVYFLWFDKDRDVASVRGALGKAMEAAMRANNKTLVEAVETFVATVNKSTPPDSPGKVQTPAKKGQTPKTTAPKPPAKG